MDDGATQTPARAREDGKASDHQEDGAWQGDFATLGSLWGTGGSWAELGIPSVSRRKLSVFLYRIYRIYVKSIYRNDLYKKMIYVKSQL